MEEQNKFEEVTESVKQYINTRYELMVLKTTEKVSNVGSEAVSVILIAKIAGLAILLLSFAVAFYLSCLVGDTYSGFLIVGGIYFIVTLILIGFRKSLLIKPFRNIIIRSMFKQHNN
ncbi:MAG TPA: phage holin family protein [Bacteroidia bacterium]|nr:phage holin family protein [Bacteroidia bacterium]